MTEILIEPFSPRYSADDIYGLIVPIQQEEFGIAITREGQSDLARIQEFYQTGNGNFWVASANGAVIGTVALTDIGNRQVALRKMFVRADHRGKDKGVAQKLWENVLKWAKAHKLADIYLGTTSKFLAAHRFYEKNGFVEIDKADLPLAFPIMAVDSKFYRYRLG